LQRVVSIRNLCGAQRERLRVGRRDRRGRAMVRSAVVHEAPFGSELINPEVLYHCDNVGVEANVEKAAEYLEALSARHGWERSKRGDWAMRRQANALRREAHARMLRDRRILEIYCPLGAWEMGGGVLVGQGGVGPPALQGERDCCAMLRFNTETAFACLYRRTVYWRHLLKSFRLRGLK
jgi:hypothetical protein